jgi:anti-sigma28 factor (negative regulator of flagellin synthesis)
MKKNKLSFSLLSGKNMPPAAPTRQERVETVKQAVEAGTYRVDTRALADSLLRQLLWDQWERARRIKP